MKERGFKEVPHTADWALQVWAPDLSGLFHSAAQGMVSLMGVELHPDSLSAHFFSLKNSDPESLLVAFLSELLFIMQEQNQGFAHLALAIDGPVLHAALSTAPVMRIDKEIKAVTYHNLDIHWDGDRYTATITFDV